MKLPLLTALLFAPLTALCADGKASKPNAHSVAGEEMSFSNGVISQIAPASEWHESSVKNGVRFGVYYDLGTKSNVAIYAVNTGRKQLVLKPEKHRAILENLIKRKFTVVVSSFRDKQLKGLEPEKYMVQLTADVREAVDGVSRETVSGCPQPGFAKSATRRTGTDASDYFALMPGFTMRRDVEQFRYGNSPVPIRRELALQLGKPFQETDADVANTYDIICPVYGPAVGMLTNYASNEIGRENYYATEKTDLVMAFAFKNLAIVHQQCFNDPAGGSPKGYGYCGDQSAAKFIRHLKGNAAKYHLDPETICCFGHSKGSEVPSMLVNRLRRAAPHLHTKVDFKS